MSEVNPTIMCRLNKHEDDTVVQIVLQILRNITTHFFLGTEVDTLYKNSYKYRTSQMKSIVTYLTPFNAVSKLLLLEGT